VTILTIGHSTRTLLEFILKILKGFMTVTTVVDVRSVPRYRHNPQFNKETLPVSSSKKKLATYICPKLVDLGARSPTQLITAWRNTKASKATADYIRAKLRSYKEQLLNLMALAREQLCPRFMCAEALPVAMPPFTYDLTR